MHSPFLARAAIAALLLTASAPAPTLAQEDDEYRELVRAAVQEHTAGHFAEACALFRRAHERSPNARTLRGIGMTNFELRQYAAAIVALQGALAETRRPLTEEQRAGTQDLIERSQAFVARYTLLPAEALEGVRVDGVAGVVGPDGELLVDLGAHEIQVRCEGCVTDPRRVRVVGGEHGELDFTAAPTTPDLAIGTEPEPAKPEPEGGLSGATIGLLVGAAVAGAGAVGTGLWWRDRNSEIDRCDSRPDCLNRDRLKTERNATVGVALGLSIAAAGLLTVGLLTIDGEDDEDGRALSCGVAGMGMACAGTF